MYYNYLKNIPIIAIMTLFFNVATWQMQAQTLSLSQCLEKGKANYPLLAGKGYVNSASEHKLKSLQSQYYPQLDFTGQMTWQSDVPHMVTPNLPVSVAPPSQDQYKAYVDLKQVIYDGGAIAASKKVEKLKNGIDQQSIEVDLYAIRNRIIDAYFLVLSIDKQIEQIDFNINDLTNRIQEANARVSNGATLKSNAELLEVEQLKLMQTKSSLSEGRLTAIEILSEFTGEKIDASVNIELPLMAASDSTVTRPELTLMAQQQEQLQASESLIGKARMPKLSACGQLGYGNPGYNVLLDSFEPYYMVGLRLNWNIWDWKKTSHDKEALKQQELVINTKQETFLMQINLSKVEIESRIRRNQQALELDRKIIALRESIRIASQSQLNNGVITTSDYIVRLNEAMVAKLTEALHQIELSKATVELANLVGNSI
jgi:outer membrane protein TolC